MEIFSNDKKEDAGFVINTNAEIIDKQKNTAPDLDIDNSTDLQELQTTSALNALKKRMTGSISSNSSVTNNVSSPELPSSKSNPAQNTSRLQEVITPNKVESTKGETDKNQPITTAEPKVSVNNLSSKKPLIEKVKRYTIDEHGNNAAENEAPLYQLESVAEILKNNSESALEELSKKYDISFDDLGKSQNKQPPIEPKFETVNTTANSLESKIKVDTITPTPAFERMVNDSATRESQELFESLFPSDVELETPDISVPHISDIDTHEVGITTENQSNTATIRFTPVSGNKGNTDHITISSVTKYIDLDDSVPEELPRQTETQLEQSDFEDFLPKNEYSDINSGKKLMLNLARQKRSGFLGSFVSALMLIALLIFLIPFVYDFIISNTKTAMFICTAFLGLSTLANIDMFTNFKNIAKKRCNFDVLAAICSISTLSLGITAALTDSDAYYIILLCAFILLVRAICKFKYVSAKALSLKQISNKNPKNALTLISDPATTFAMAKDSIDGDVLIAAHKKSDFIEDFSKHFDFHKTLFGKVSLLFIITLLVSLIGAIGAYFYYDSIFSAFYAASCITCIAAIPSAFFIDAIPFSSATKKLNLNLAMISGIYGAELIENSNAAVVRVDDIFPKGTITMHNMKVLSDNNIDQILLRAASLTAAIGSPLEPIFRDIAGTSDAYSMPNSDTIKYEKNLGISGWVDNEPLFIGNRSLMKAHGIEIPSLEVDKKILRKGYFPVYVATSNTACALIVIQYDVKPDVAKELNKITNLGIMLLVENCDPNVTEAMICDYFGLHEDSIKIMSNAGVHMYKNAEPDVLRCSAPAAYRGSGLNFIKIINCASGIKESNRLLTILYSIFAVLGAVYFIYAAFSGLMTMPEQTTVLLYVLGTFVLSIIGFLIRKP
ncbi:MAG: hypothetical protein Q4B40_04445 [Clostridia bacterium]|nr:hypothetical protein [Clostridia bacterium]